MQVTVKMTSGKIVPMEMVTTDKISKVKTKLQKDEGVDPKQIKLVLDNQDSNSKELTDDQTLEAVKAQCGSSNLAMLVKEKMFIDVKLVSGNTVPLELDTTNKISDVK